MQRLNFQEKNRKGESHESIRWQSVTTTPDPATQGLAYAPERENCVAEKLGKMNQ